MVVKLYLLNFRVHHPLVTPPTFSMYMQLKVLMKEYIADVKSEGVVLGDNLETALELGEKHEAFVTKCKTVS